MLRYVRNRIEIIQCWRDLHRVKGVTDVSALDDFVFTRTICPTQAPPELIDLMETVEKLKPAAAIEVGTHRGGTLFLLCRLSAPSATISSIDLPHKCASGSSVHGYKKVRVPLYKRFALEGQSLHLLRQDSHDPDTTDRVKNIRDLSCSTICSST